MPPRSRVRDPGVLDRSRPVRAASGEHGVDAGLVGRALRDDPADQLSRSRGCIRILIVVDPTGY
jgi:hypothetical protein